MELESFLASQRERWDTCTACEIGCMAHKKVLFDLVDSKDFPLIPKLDRLPLLFIGEAPGESEDAIGLPFIGRSGKLLRRTCLEVMHDLRAMVPYGIANCVACRPRDAMSGPNRRPTEEELRRCSPRLVQLLAHLNPRVIVTLGRTAEREIASLACCSSELCYIVNLVHPAYLARGGGIVCHAFPKFYRGLRDAFECAVEYIEHANTAN